MPINDSILRARGRDDDIRNTADVNLQYFFKPIVANAKDLRFNYANKPSWSKAYRGSGLIMGTPAAPPGL